MGEPMHAVTGAFGYSGRYIARRLLDAEHRVVTLTNRHTRHSPFGDRVRAYPLDFDRVERLAESLRDVSVLYNTYWVRFNHPSFTHAQAVQHTHTLFEAARRAGVERIVHVSVTNPSEDSPLEYFRGKAQLERALSESGLSHAILRPTVLFGTEDILINNIAWMLRRFPVFGVFGDGTYRLRPMYVDDLAALAVAQGARRDNTVVDAVGPETFTYRELAATVGRIIGARRPIVSVPPPVGYWIGRAVGLLVRDVVVTREEIEGLMANLLCVDGPPAGTTRLTVWAEQHKHTLGLRYSSELARRAPSSGSLP